MLTLKNLLLKTTAIRHAALLTTLWATGYCTPGIADALVWKATKSGETIYLGGTIHVLRESDYPLPTEYETAYKASDNIYFEVDTALLQSPQGQALTMGHMMHPPGATLQTELSPKSFALLSEALQAKGMNIETFMGFKASMAILTLVTLELATIGVNPQSGVETYFADKATADKKTVKGLETLEEHLAVLGAMGAGIEDELVEQSLNDIKELKSSFKKMIYAWKEGDIETLDKFFIKEMKKYPALYNSLLVTRNNAWIETIDTLIKTPGIEYILVGSAHLIGEDSVLNLLQKKGYAITQVAGTTAKTPKAPSK